ALEQLDGALVHAVGGRGVAVAVMHDAAAVGRATDGHVVEPEPVEDGGDGADHVRGAQDIAAQVEDDPVRLRLLLGRRQAPRALFGKRGEVLRQRDLTEVLAVVVAHLTLPGAVAARAVGDRRASPCPSWSRATPR